MTKIESEIRAAWIKGNAKSKGNTKTDGKSVWLYGNKIIDVNQKNEVLVSLAGWDTRTTKDRCNNIADAHFHTKNFEPYHNNIAIDSEEWINLGIKQ